MKNRIGWCNLTFNPVWGCLNNCEYCYARIFANRFGGRRAFWEMKYKYKNYFMGDDISEYWELKNRLKDFKLTFSERKFNKKLPKKPQRIFVGSMSEIYYWKTEWIERVIEKVKQSPQHTFMFLTKYPEIYNEWVFPKNCWLGITITHIPKYEDGNRWDFNGFIRNEKINNLKFVSFEPLLGDIHPYTYLNFDREIDWIIFGAESGNRKDRVIPKREWMEDIINHCKYRNIPVYLKDNLKEIYPVEMKEFPVEA